MRPRCWSSETTKRSEFSSCLTSMSIDDRRFRNGTLAAAAPRRSSNPGNQPVDQLTNQLTDQLSNSATPAQQLQAAIHRSIVGQFMPVPGAGPRAPHAGVVSASLIGMDLRSVGHGRRRFSGILDKLRRPMRPEAPPLRCLPKAHPPVAVCYSRPVADVMFATKLVHMYVCTCVQKYTNLYTYEQLHPRGVPC